MSDVEFRGIGDVPCVQLVVVVKLTITNNTQNPQRFVDLCKLMNSYRAAQCNAPQGRFAEAYSFSSSFPFTDIREILPPSLKVRSFHIDNQNGFL